MTLKHGTLVRAAWQLTLVIFAGLNGGTVAQAQVANPCDIFAKIPVFTEERMNSESALKTDFHRLECASDWTSHQDAVNAGISVGTVVYGVPLKLDGTFDRNQVDAWKRDNCSAEDRNSDALTIISKSYIRYDPVNSANALECIRVTTNQDALICNLDEYSDAVIFNVQWRRTYGEKEDAAPVIEGFAAENVDRCALTELVQPGERVPDGGRTVTCVRSKVPSVFVVNTNRGMCSKIGSAKSEPRVLSGRMELNGPLTLSGAPVKFEDGLEIITGSHPVSIQAPSIEIRGQVTIRSFGVNDSTASKFGASAGTIFIQANDVVGNGAIAILQAGQDAGPGMSGAPGAPGSPGSPGVARNEQQKQVCETVLDPLGLFKSISREVCKASFAGCEGGKNGTPGTDGGEGQGGGDGYPGGAAGEVTISVPPHLRDKFVVLTNTSSDGKTRDCSGKICGGLGGPGGSGGPGGPGGAGGPGAPGTTFCGGTDAGAPGKAGSQGPNGNPGQTGAHARLKI